MKKFLLILFLIVFIPIKVNAFDLGKSAILMEEDSKRILVSKNINKKMLIASTTKIMTAIIAIESGKLNDVITVNDKVLEAYGSSIYLNIGEEMSLVDMIYGLMMQSGNDAALMIADYLYGEEEFVKKMNDKAKMIGMENTIFNNPHGLDEKTQNYSTAYDMALLMRYANSYDEFRKITGCKKKKVTTNKKSYIWNNKNKLLYNYKYTTGGKTGYTDKANRTLVTSASNGNLNLVAVTLDDPNDFLNHQKMYEYGFENYNYEKILDKDKLKLPNKNMYIEDDYFYPITKAEKDLINIEYVIKDKKKYKNNEKVGKLIIKLGNKKIHEEKIYIYVKEKNNNKKSLFERIIEWLPL